MLCLLQLIWYTVWFISVASKDKSKPYAFFCIIIAETKAKIEKSNSSQGLLLDICK